MFFEQNIANFNVWCSRKSPSNLCSGDLMELSELKTNLTGKRRYLAYCNSDIGVCSKNGGLLKTPDDPVPK